MEKSVCEEWPEGFRYAEAGGNFSSGVGILYTEAGLE